jgi:hypothetical protein
MNIQSITTSLAFFLSNVFEADEPDSITVKPDFEPQPMTRVLYMAANGQYRSATYVGLWAHIRPLRFLG